MKIILASKSGVRKQILDRYKIDNEVMASHVDEDEVKKSLLAEGANPLVISKIGSLVFIAKSTPAAISLFSSSTGTMMDFANTNEIDTKPLEEAKDAMGD